MVWGFLLVLMLWSTPAHAIVYLCPVDGAGTDTNPFRSRAITERLPGRGNIDLRVNVTQASGYMLCESDALPTNMTGVVTLGARNLALSAGLKTAIANATGRALTGTTVEEAIKQLVIAKMPRPQSGQYEIILGSSQPRILVTASLRNDIRYKGLAVAAKQWGQAAVAALWDQLTPAVAWASRLAVETFNCSDDASLTCVHTWADKSGTALNIVSNQASASGSGTSIVNSTTALATTDHEIGATIIQATTGGVGTNTACSILGRTTNDATQTFYRVAAFVRNSGELNDVTLIRTVTGSTTAIAVDTTDFALNDILAVRMVGTTVSARKNSVQILSQTDSEICEGCANTPGKYGGLRSFSDSASGVCTFDNWRAYDIGGVRGIPWFN